jgi:membrane protease YdiL (CAAX protease family)
MTDGTSRRQWPTALYVSVLWGLWHLPIAGGGGQPLAATVAQLLVVHCAIGVPLSLGWRRTGNLAVPALAHALIDAVRNALIAGL